MNPRILIVLDSPFALHTEYPCFSCSRWRSRRMMASRILVVMDALSAQHVDPPPLFNSIDVFKRYSVLTLTHQSKANETYVASVRNCASTVFHALYHLCALCLRFLSWSQKHTVSGMDGRRLRVLCQRLASSWPMQPTQPTATSFNPPRTSRATAVSRGHRPWFSQQTTSPPHIRSRA